MNNLKIILGLFIIGLLWLIIIFHPVVIAIYYSNPLWLFLYILIYYEVVAGIILTRLIIALIELTE